MPRVKHADSIMQPDLIKRIHKKLDVPVKALNEQLKLIRDREAHQNKEPFEPLEVGALTTVNPALDFIGDTALIMPCKGLWTPRVGFLVGKIPW
jgi:hypothetical protein